MRRMSTNLSDRMAENMPERTLERMSEDMPERCGGDWGLLSIVSFIIAANELSTPTISTLYGQMQVAQPLEALEASIDKLDMEQALVVKRMKDGVHLAHWSYSRFFSEVTIKSWWIMDFKYESVYIISNPWEKTHRTPKSCSRSSRAKSERWFRISMYQPWMSCANPSWTAWIPRAVF